MFYFHQATVFPSERLSLLDDSLVEEIRDGKILAPEPANLEIPQNLIRRMGKGVRMAIKCAFPILKSHNVNAIIIGTSSAGHKDSIDFLEQIRLYDEGILTPLNFVRGVPNSIATQLALLNSNTGYNNTHVHKGLAFEGALFDAFAYLAEFDSHKVIVGSVDEISRLNFKIDLKNGYYHGKSIKAKSYYSSGLIGTVAGEGASTFLISKCSKNAIGKLLCLKTFHCSTGNELKSKIIFFLDKLSKNVNVDVLVSGESGDSEHVVFPEIIESFFSKIPVIRFKHICGDFPTASSIGLGISIQIINKKSIPQSYIKNKILIKTPLKHILVYNHYHGIQHSLMLVSTP